MDFTQTKVEDLRKMLVTKYGYSEESANAITGKKNLVNEVMSKMAGENSLQYKKVSPMKLDDDMEFEVVETPNELEKAIEEVVKVTEPFPEDINNQHPRWTEYVLGHLTEDEKQGKYPTSFGLRRMTEKFVGKIIHSRSKIVMAPSNINGNHAAVVVTITVEGHDGTVQVMDGAADASDYNTEKEYRRFTVSVAQTRAEARCYTRILRLKTVSADEIVDESSLTYNDGAIRDTQKRLIKNLTDRNNIDIRKFLDKQGLVNVELEDLKDSKAQEICQILNSYGVIPIPEDILK